MQRLAAIVVLFVVVVMETVNAAECQKDWYMIDSSSGLKCFKVVETHCGESNKDAPNVKKIAVVYMNMAMKNGFQPADRIILTEDSGTCQAMNVRTLEIQETENCSTVADVIYSVCQDPVSGLVQNQLCSYVFNSGNPETVDVFKNTKAYEVRCARKIDGNKMFDGSGKYSCRRPRIANEPVFNPVETCTCPPAKVLSQTDCDCATGSSYHLEISYDSSSQCAPSLKYKEVNGPCPHCKLNPPSIMCLYNNWSEFGECSVKCGSTGKRQRTRKIMKEYQFCKDKYLKEKVVCVEISECQYCQVYYGKDGWSKCSEVCNKGIKTRTIAKLFPLKDIDQRCAEIADKQKDVQNCFDKPCPIDCTMTDWEPWSRCDAGPLDCGNGTKTRSRKVDKEAQFGGSCSDALTQTGSCYGRFRECPTPCEYGEWGNWTTCPPCKPADKPTPTKTRHREISTPPSKYGEKCNYSALEETANCTLKQCRKANGATDEEKDLMKVVLPIGGAILILIVIVTCATIAFTRHRKTKKDCKCDSGVRRHKGDETKPKEDHKATEHSLKGHSTMKGDATKTRKHKRKPSKSPRSKGLPAHGRSQSPKSKTGEKTRSHKMSKTKRTTVKKK